MLPYGCICTSTCSLNTVPAPANCCECYGSCYLSPCTNNCNSLAASGLDSPNQQWITSNNDGLTRSSLNYTGIKNVGPTETETFITAAVSDRQQNSACNADFPVSYLGPTFSYNPNNMWTTSYGNWPGNKVILDVDYSAVPIDYITTTATVTVRNLLQVTSTGYLYLQVTRCDHSGTEISQPDIMHFINAGSERFDFGFNSAIYGRYVCPDLDVEFTQTPNNESSWSNKSWYSQVISPISNHQLIMDYPALTQPDTLDVDEREWYGRRVQYANKEQFKLSLCHLYEPTELLASSEPALPTFFADTECTLAIYADATNPSNQCGDFDTADSACITGKNNDPTASTLSGCQEVHTLDLNEFLMTSIDSSFIDCPPIQQTISCNAPFTLGGPLYCEFKQNIDGTEDYSKLDVYITDDLLIQDYTVNYNLEVPNSSANSYGQQACQDHGYDQTQCEEIGCCVYTSGLCLHDISLCIQPPINYSLSRTFTIRIDQQLEIASSMDDCFCLTFDSGAPEECLLEYSMREDDNYGDYFLVKTDNLFPTYFPDAELYEKSSTFVVNDAGTLTTESTYLSFVDSHPDHLTTYQINPTSLSDSSFTQFEGTTYVQQNMEFAYSYLPNVSVIGSGVTINFVECQNQDTVLPNPVFPEVPWYILAYKEVSYTLSDSDYDHDEAWCYPLKEFSLIDIDTGYPVEHSLSNLANEVRQFDSVVPSSTAEPDIGYEEYYRQNPTDSSWYDHYYSITPTFFKPSVMTTHPLQLKVVNRADQVFTSDPFNLVFFRIKIQQIWSQDASSTVLNPYEDNLNVFSFAQQTIFYDGSQIKDGKDASNKKVYSNTNYFQANVNEDATILAIWDEYDMTLFKTFNQRATYHHVEQTQMWVEIADLDTILEAEFTHEIKRKVFIEQQGVPDTLSDGKWVGDTLWRDLKEVAMVPGYPNYIDAGSGQPETWFKDLSDEDKQLVIALHDKQALIGVEDELLVTPYDFYQEDFTLTFTYRLVDCSQDFSPVASFITKHLDQDHNFVDYESEGTLFIFESHAESRDYLLDLVPIPQQFWETCGPAVYDYYISSISKRDLFELEDDLLKFTMPALISSFTQPVQWSVHNDYMSYDLGETSFEVAGCMTYLIQELESEGGSPDFTILLPNVVNKQIAVRLYSLPETISWPEFTWQADYPCAIERYTVACIDQNGRKYEVDFEGTPIDASSEACAGFTYYTSARTIETALITSLDSIYIGMFIFQVRGANTNTPSEISNIYEFTVKLSFPENSPPVLSSPPQFVAATKSLFTVIQLGRITDLEFDDVYLEEWDVDGEENPYDWVSFYNSTNPNGLSFEFTPDMNEKDVAFNITFTIVDTHVNPKESTYSFRVEVGDDATFVSSKTQDQRPPYIIFNPVDFEDNISIIFTERVIISQQFNLMNLTSENQGSEVFEITYRPSEATLDYVYQLEQHSNKMLWNITSYTSQGIQFDLSFTDPTSVSTNGMNPDKIYFKVLRPEVFIGNETRKASEVFPNQRNYFDSVGFVSRLKGINKQSKDEQALLESSSDNFETLIQGIMAGNAIVSLFLSGIFQYLAGLIFSLQMLVITVFFNVQTPANSHKSNAHSLRIVTWMICVFFNVQTPANSHIIQVTILKLCAFDFFSTETITIDFLGMDPGESFNDIFDDTGTEGSNYIICIGSLFIYMFLFLPYVLIHQLSKLLIGDRVKWLANFNQPKKYIIIVIEFIIGGCFELGLSALICISMLDSSDFSTFWSFVSTMLAFVTLIALIGAPVYIHKTAKLYHTDYFEREKYDDLFNDKKKSSIYALNSYNVFLLRRYSIVVVLIFLQAEEYQLIQINIQLGISMCYLMYMLTVKPYREKSATKQEAINEFIVLQASYLLFFYTGVYPYSFVYAIGWVTIGFICLLILINILRIAKTLTSIMKRKVKRRALKKRKKEAFRKWVRRRQLQAEVERQRQLETLMHPERVNIQTWRQKKARRAEAERAHNQKLIRDLPLDSVSEHDEQSINSERQPKPICSMTYAAILEEAREQAVLEAKAVALAAESAVAEVDLTQFHRSPFTLQLYGESSLLQQTLHEQQHTDGSTETPMSYQDAQKAYYEQQKAVLPSITINSIEYTQQKTDEQIEEEINLESRRINNPFMNQPDLKSENVFSKMAQNQENQPGLTQKPDQRAIIKAKKDAFRLKPYDLDIRQQDLSQQYHPKSRAQPTLKKPFHYQPGYNDQVELRPQTGLQYQQENFSQQHEQSYNNIKRPYDIYDDNDYNDKPAGNPTELIYQCAAELDLNRKKVVKYVKILEANYIDSNDQLRLFNDKQWKLYGFPPILTYMIKKKLNKRVIQLDEISGPKKLVKPETEYKIDLYDDSQITSFLRKDNDY